MRILYSSNELFNSGPGISKSFLMKRVNFLKKGSENKFFKHFFEYKPTQTIKQIFIQDMTYRLISLTPGRP